MSPSSSNIAPESSDPTFFALPPLQDPPSPQGSQNTARLRRARRSQLTWGPIDLDAQLPEDHPARAIQSVIDRLDLSSFYTPIRALENTAGAPAIDPKILLTLWVYATSEGEGSAREIARLTQLHAAYRWICGGVSVACHTLSDFRTRRREQIDGLITNILALLLDQDLIRLFRLSQDGTRVRASAGSSSFRTEGSLQTRMDEARRHLEKVTRQAADPDQPARKLAAQMRSAKDRIARLEAAIAQIPEVVATKKRSGSKDSTPRVSMTDPDARIMKMGGGGYRPAYNVQIASTTDAARVIVGIDVVNRGSDSGQLIPMVEQVVRRTGIRPQEVLVDGGFAQHDTIDQACERDITVYAPVPARVKEPHKPRKGDSPAVAAWRERMGTESAKQIYRQRAATIETVNADAKRHRGLDAMPVRGLKNAAACASLFALTYNILRVIALGG